MNGEESAAAHLSRLLPSRRPDLQIGDKMPGDSSLRRYLETVAEQHNQICDALRDDKNSKELARACKKWKKGFWPPDGKTSLLLNEWDQSDALHTLYKKAFAEIVQADLGEHVQTILENLHARHKEVLASALLLFESEANWMVASEWKGTWLAKPSDIRPDDTEFKRATAAARTAWHELDSFVLGVEAKLKDGKSLGHPRAHPKRLTPKGIVYDDDNKTVTINGITYPKISNIRAYRLFKLVADAGGEAVSRKAILAAIPALHGKNSIANTREKLPAPLRYCLKGNIGREGGYSYRDPKKKR